MNTCSIECSSEVAEKIKFLKIDKLLLSEPVSLSSPSDVLDAPINPDEIKDYLMLVKVVFQAGSAAISFASALNKILKEGDEAIKIEKDGKTTSCLLYTSPSPRDLSTSRMPSSA